MIKYKNKVKQEFTDKKHHDLFVKKGIDMSDSKFIIIETESGEEYVVSKDEPLPQGDISFYPTYTLSEIIYKLWEWDEKYGELRFFKDAPFYCFYYKKKDEKANLESIHEYPLYAAAGLLLMCADEEIGIGYVKNISDKK